MFWSLSINDLFIWLCNYPQHKATGIMICLIFFIFVCQQLTLVHCVFLLVASKKSHPLEVSNPRNYFLSVDYLFCFVHRTENLQDESILPPYSRI